MDIMQGYVNHLNSKPSIETSTMIWGYAYIRNLLREGRMEDAASAYRVWHKRHKDNPDFRDCDYYLRDDFHHAENVRLGIKSPLWAKFNEVIEKYGLEQAS